MAGSKEQVSLLSMEKFMMGRTICETGMQFHNSKSFLSEPNFIQLHEKIIPEFEWLHGPEYKALLMVDNSQGHVAYTNDALLASKMNLNPGGAVPKLWYCWFIWNGC